MDRDDTIVCKETLQYFGNMLPSLSHEAKNILAVINENAGLMNDFILMAQKGDRTAKHVDYGCPSSRRWNR